MKCEETALGRRLSAAALATAFVLALVQAPSGLAQHTGHYPRPAPMGVSISTTPSLPYLFAGTAGMLVSPWWAPELPLILSNNHVMGAVGPDLCPDSAPAWTWVLQPGTLDIGDDPGEDLDYAVGWTVARVPIDFTPGADNYVDAALALTGPALTRPEIEGIGVPTRALGFPAPGMALVKSGRTSGVTDGTVLIMNVTVRVYYGEDCGIARFVGQTVTTGGLGSPGDSGSVVLDAESLTPVGLYFAGSDFIGVMNPIWRVYLSLGVFVHGGAAPALAPASRGLAARAAVDRLEPLRARNEPRLMALPEVVGLGIADTRDGRGLGLAVLARRLTPALQAAVPADVEGVPVQVIEVGEIVAH